MKYVFFTKGGNEYTLDLDPATSIRDTKQFFQILYSLNSEKIQIIYHNRILDDSETLSSFKNPIFPGLFIVSKEIHDFDDNMQVEIPQFSSNSKSKGFYEDNIVRYEFNSVPPNQNKNLSCSNFLTFRLSKLFPDNFTTFQTIIANSNVLNSITYNIDIQFHKITSNLSKSIGESLKPTLLLSSPNESKSIHDYFILRSKTQINQNSRLFQYNLHQHSIISYNCESSFSKCINIIISFQKADSKIDKKISYNFYQEMTVFNLKKIIAKDFLNSDDPNSVILFASPNIVMVDNRKLQYYKLLNNSIIKMRKSSMSRNEVMVVIEQPSKSFELIFTKKTSFYNFRLKIFESTFIKTSKQYLFRNHEMILDENYNLNSLSQYKTFAIQLRTKRDSVYGVEFETGVIYYFDVNDDQNVFNLKTQIRELIGIPVTNIQLIYNNIILKDEATLGELSINYFSIITCKKQGFYQNIPIKIKTPILEINQYISPHTYASDLGEIAKRFNKGILGDTVSIYIPILLFDQSIKLSEIEHSPETKFVLLEKRPNSFYAIIKTVFNDFFYLPVFPEMTVKNLTSLIKLLLNFDGKYSSFSIRLMCYGIILKDIYTLGQYKICPKTFIDVYLYPI